MNVFEEFSLENIICTLEFDIKHYQKKYEYHQGLAQVYEERITQLQNQICKLRKDLEEGKRI